MQPQDVGWATGWEVGLTLVTQSCNWTLIRTTLLKSELFGMSEAVHHVR